jgi:hypothetical protein
MSNEMIACTEVIDRQTSIKTITVDKTGEILYQERFSYGRGPYLLTDAIGNPTDCGTADAKA